MDAESNGWSEERAPDARASEAARPRRLAVLREECRTLVAAGDTTLEGGCA